MVFEVINDRGVRLRPYEIIKGKLLGQIDKLELDQRDYNVSKEAPESGLSNSSHDNAKQKLTTFFFATT